MVRKWGRIRTSQWHLIHSVRAGTIRSWDGPSGAYKQFPIEFLLTVDGYQLPTERDVRDNWYRRTGQRVSTGAKTWEGEGFPKGAVCRNCSSFVSHLKDTVEIA